MTIASMLVDVLNQKFNKQAKLGVEPLHCWSKSMVDSEYMPVNWTPKNPALRSDARGK